MSRYLTITHSNAISFAERKKTIKNQPVAVGRATLNFLLVTLVCALAVMYIAEVNGVATMGYTMREKEKDLQEAKTKNVNLKIKEAELKSMYNLEQKTKELNMTVPGDVSYLTLPGNMAMK